MEKVEPLRDLETINLELIFADIEVLDKRLLKLEKLIRSGDAQAQKDQSNYTFIKKHDGEWSSSKFR